MRLYRDTSVGEKFVSHVWNGGHFVKDNLRTKDGRRLAVVNQGQWNDDEGADFHNAEIEIGDKIYKGDVEIHVRGSHWRIHHHDIDPLYNNTILHVVMWDDTIRLLTRKQNGEFIPTLVLYDHLDMPIGKLRKQIESGNNKEKPCPANTKKISQEFIAKTLDNAGMERFFIKSKIFENENADQTIYERIMEALGYSKNKDQFRELAIRIPLKEVAGRDLEEIQAILFGISGLLPSQDHKPKKIDEETKEQISKLSEIWGKFSQNYKNKRMDRKQWNFFRVRRENHPVKRIAGVSYILSKWDSGFLTAFDESSQIPQKLRDILMAKASGYWTKYYDFGRRQYGENQYLIGENRADDIIINVILPSVFAYAQRMKDENLQNSVISVYSSYKKLQDNKITRYMEDRISAKGVKSALRQQGLIHLYKSYCDSNNCKNCPLSTFR